MANLGKIPEFKRNFWKAIGDEVADRIRVHTTKGGKDVFNKNFKQYSTGYAERKPKINTTISKPSNTMAIKITTDAISNLPLIAAIIA